MWPTLRYPKDTRGEAGGGGPFEGLRPMASPRRQRVDPGCYQGGIPASVGGSKSASFLPASSLAAFEHPGSSIGTGGRSRGTCTQEGCRVGVATALARVLRTAVCSPEGKRRVASSSGPVHSQPLPPEDQVPHGDPRLCAGSNPAGRLGYFHRPLGRILPCDDASQGEEVSQVRLEGRSIPVSRSSIRALPSPLDLHQGGARDLCCRSRPRHIHEGLPRHNRP